MQTGRPGSEQVPQVPPQPSDPQTFPEQPGVQTSQLPSALQTGASPTQPRTRSSGLAQSGSGAPQLQSQLSSASYRPIGQVQADGTEETHWPEALQRCPVWQPASGASTRSQSGSRTPQAQSQLSDASYQSGSQLHDFATHRPLAPQLASAAHDPQSPPQPSSPQFRPPQFGTHFDTQRPFNVSQMGNEGSLQVPQEPPQPSPPHFRPTQ